MTKLVISSNSPNSHSSQPRTLSHVRNHWLSLDYFSKWVMLQLLSWTHMSKTSLMPQGVGAGLAPQWAQCTWCLLCGPESSYKTLKLLWRQVCSIWLMTKLSTILSSSKFSIQALTAVIQQISSEAPSEKLLSNIYSLIQEKAEQKARCRNHLTQQHK